MEEYIQVGEHIFRADEVDNALLVQLGMADLSPGRTSRRARPLSVAVAPTGERASKRSGKEPLSSSVAILKSKPCLLHLEATGCWGGPARQQTLDQIARLSEQYKAERLLVDLQAIDMEIGTVDEFYLVHDLVSREFYRFEKVAFVVAGQLTRFFENIARKEMIRLRLFTEPVTAIDWLESSAEEGVSGSRLQKAS